MDSARLTNADRKEMDEFGYVLLEVTIPDIRTAIRDVFFEEFAKVIGGRPGTIANLLSEDRPLTDRKFYALKRAFQQCQSISTSHQNLFKAWCMRIEEKLADVDENQTDDTNADPTVIKIEQKKSDEEAPLIRIIEKDNRQFSKSDVIETFENTNWFCYSRHETKIGSTVGQLVVRFRSFNENNECDVDIDHFVRNIGPWKGIARFNEDDKIVWITATNTANKGRDYSHFLFKLKNILSGLELCITHMTFRHKTHDYIVTKTGVLVRAKPHEVLAPREYQFNDENLNEYIRLFLSVRSSNRLSTPRVMPVYDLETLAGWMTGHQPQATVDYPLIDGSYNLYYRIVPNSAEFITDKVMLSSSLGRGIKAIYTHQFLDRTLGTWQGEGLPNNETHLLTIHLRGPRLEKRDPLGNHLLDNDPLILNIPIPKSREGVKIDTLTGIITGARDTPKAGTVARLFIMTRSTEQQPNPEGFSLSELNDYFDYYANRSWVRPPSSSIIFQFIHLKDAIARSIEENKKGQED